MRKVTETKRELNRFKAMARYALKKMFELETKLAEENAQRKGGVADGKEGA